MHGGRPEPAAGGVGPRHRCSRSTPPPPPRPRGSSVLPGRPLGGVPGRGVTLGSCSVRSSSPPPGHPGSSGSSRPPRSPGTSSAGSSPAPPPTTRCARPASSSTTASRSPSTTSARTPSRPEQATATRDEYLKLLEGLAGAGLTPAGRGEREALRARPDVRRAAGRTTTRGRSARRPTRRAPRSPWTWRTTPPPTRRWRSLAGCARTSRRRARCCRRTCGGPSRTAGSWPRPGSRVRLCKGAVQGAGVGGVPVGP